MWYGWWSVPRGNRTSISGSRNRVSLERGRYDRRKTCRHRYHGESSIRETVYSKIVKSTGEKVVVWDKQRSCLNDTRVKRHVEQETTEETGLVSGKGVDCLRRLLRRLFRQVRRSPSYSGSRWVYVGNGCKKRTGRS